MKRILSITLSVILILSALCLTSCSREPSDIGVINGMDGRQVCESILDNLKSTDRYRVDMDVELGLGVLFITIPAKLDDMCVSEFDGDNIHYKFTDEGLLFIDNKTLASMVGSEFREAWYVDGTAYKITFYDEAFKHDYDPNKEDMGFTTMLVEEIEAFLLRDDAEFNCYEDKEGNTYVEFTMTEGATLSGFETGATLCRVYTDGKQIEKISVDFDVFGVKAAAFNVADFSGVVTMNFEYDESCEVSAPEGFY